MQIGQEFSEGDAAGRAEHGARGGRRRIATYHRLASTLRRRIQRGEWLLGDRLPVLDELVEECGVGRVTVRHALDILEQEGLITRHRDRRGSYVSREPLDRRWFTLALDVRDLGTHSAGITSRLIEDSPWSARLPARRAEGRPADSYRRVRQLHHYRDYPLPSALTDILVDQELHARLPKSILHNRPVLDALAAHAGLDIGHIRQTLTIGEADAELAAPLQIHEGAPVAELRRIIKDGEGKIAYLGHLSFRGELVRLDFTLKRRRFQRGGSPTEVVG